MEHSTFWSRIWVINIRFKKKHCIFLNKIYFKLLFSYIRFSKRNNYLRLFAEYEKFMKIIILDKGIKLFFFNILCVLQVSCSTRHNIKLLADIIYSVAFSVKPAGEKDFFVNIYLRLVVAQGHRHVEVNATGYRLPLEGMKYLYFNLLLSRQSVTLSFATQHARPSDVGEKWRM